MRPDSEEIVMMSNWKLLLLSGMGVLALGCGEEPGEDKDPTDPTDTTETDDPTGTDGITCENNLCTVDAGTLTGDVTFSAANDYVLAGIVTIGEDDMSVPGTLTIEAGTTIYGSNESALIISRGSQILADGTAADPIVFTSAKEDGSRGAGDWGGLIINGLATNNAGVDVQGEAGTGLHGGTDDDDDSGVLRYVRVEYGGFEIDSENQVNGIAFQSVGRGTTVEYIQVHMNKDDGVEFFGGAVEVFNVVITGAGDDAFDWTQGWHGGAQYVVLQGYADRTERGIEADNWEHGEDNDPRAQPFLANFTVIGGGDDNGDVSKEGVVLRRGTAGHLSHFIVDNFGKGCVDIDSQSTYNNAHDGTDFTGELTVDNSLFNCADFNDGSQFREGDDDEKDWTAPFTVATWAFTYGTGNSGVAPMLEDATNTTAPNFMPAKGSPALTTAALPDSYPMSFEDADFIGAMGDSDWTTGWTNFAAN